MTDDKDLPYAVASSTFTVFGIQLTVHVLNDGQRIIEGDSIQKLFAKMGHGYTNMTPDEERTLADLANYLHGG